MKAYRLRNTGGDSQRYGKCEVCHQHVNSVYLLAKMQGFNHGTKCDHYAEHSITFGHYDCLAGLTN